jgi:hypothetical protein
MWGDKLKIKFICIYLRLEKAVYIIATSELLSQGLQIVVTIIYA